MDKIFYFFGLGGLYVTFTSNTKMDTTGDLLISVLLLFIGVLISEAKQKEAARPATQHGNEASGIGGFGGNVHTGTNLRGTFVTENGVTIDTNSDYWSYTDSNTITDTRTGASVTRSYTGITFSGNESDYDQR